MTRTSIRAAFGFDEHRFGEWIDPASGLPVAFPTDRHDSDGTAHLEFTVHRDEIALAQRYVEKGLRHDLHPLVQFLDGPSGRRASLVGRGRDVWEIVATIRDNDGSIADAAEYLQVPA